MLRDRIGATAVIHRTGYAPSAPPKADRRSAPFGVPALVPLCLICVIFLLVAATIILSLIPLYTKNHGEHISLKPQSTTLSYNLPNSQILTVGALNQNQLNVLKNALQQSLNNNIQTRGIIIIGISGSAGDNSRALTASFLNLIITFTCGDMSFNRCQQIVVDLLKIFIFSSQLLDQLVSLGPTPSPTTVTTVTTTAATTISTTNATRVIARRSLTDDGAPASMVYIDSHQMAGIKGSVSSVSFYVHRTCALAQVEFAAFELVSRDTDTGGAQLILTDQSGRVQLPDATELKPYMSYITIRLCSEKSPDGDCQGTQFSVLPHHYIGIRSDNCRLGYAEPMPSTPITTWTHVDGLDPFAQPYKVLNYVPATHTILQSVQIDPVRSKDNNQIVNEKKSNNTNAPRVFFIGSYPPRQCGLARFLQDLANNYQGPHSIAAVDEEGPSSLGRNYSSKVIFRLNQTDRDAYYKLADMINSGPYDLVNIQHEYGVYGGPSGEYIIALLAALRKPVVITFHTILPKPNPFFLSLTRAICATSTLAIALSNVGRELLLDVYGIDDKKISVVYHGVPNIQYDHSLSHRKSQLGFPSDAPIIATFGLVGRSKNIQFTLRALPTVVKAVPNALYLIIGQTHPIVKIHEGESYREGLQKNITALGLTNNVRFINKFLDDKELITYLRAVDIYLTPYFHEEQYVSGTLSWAVGLGKAVVSTPYLYAKELLSDGRGFLVPFEDDKYLGTILTSLLQDETKRNKARRRAYHFGRQMTWDTVANKLQDIFRQLILFN